jgi:hypothetical protein
MSLSFRVKTKSVWSMVIHVSLASTLWLSSGLVLPAANVSAAVPPPPHAITGILTPVGTIDPLHPPTDQSPSLQAAPAQARLKGTRPTRPQALTRSNRNGEAPQAASGIVEAKPNGTLRQNFNGVSSLDSAVTNFGAEFEPPDQGLCVGNGFVLEAVNSAFTIYRTNGSAVVGPLNVNVLFGDGLREFTSDPRCTYDRATNTWFAIILFINDAGTAARTDIAVSSSGDPTRPWTIYHLDATDDGTNGTPNHPGCPCLGDQPLLGIDQENLYISTNEFSILGPEFNGAQIYAIAKSELVAATAAHFVQFDNLTIDGTVATSVQPALTYQSAAAEYFLSSLDPTGTSDNRIGVWALTDRQAVRRGGVPRLSNLVIASETYGIPPGTVQQGSTSLLDSGDDRMMQVQFINGNIWGALGTAVTLPNDTDSRAGIAWFKVRPRLDGQRLRSAQMVNQGYLAAKGKYLIYPALEVTPDDHAAMVFSISGSTLFPGAAYAVLSNDQSTFGRIKIAAPGTGPYDPDATRWGDYSAAALDPDGTSVWLATEYIPSPASQTVDGRRNWGTRVLRVDARGD